MVYSHSVDLRKGVEPLCGIARSSGRKPTDGSVYVFFNRSRTLMNLLHWERGGYAIYYKRMEVGRISRKVFRQSDKPGFYFSSFIYCLIIAGLSLLTTICVKKEQIIIKIDEN